MKRQNPRPGGEKEGERQHWAGKAKAQARGDASAVGTRILV